MIPNRLAAPLLPEERLAEEIGAPGLLAQIARETGNRAAMCLAV